MDKIKTSGQQKVLHSHIIAKIVRDERSNSTCGKRKTEKIIADYISMMMELMLSGYAYELPVKMGTMCIFKQLYWDGYCYRLVLDSDILSKNGMQFSVSDKVKKEIRKRRKLGIEYRKRLPL